MTKSEKILLEHIMESIEKIENFTRDISKDDFFDSDLIQDGVIRRLAIIGEAVKNLPMALRMKYPDIEWKKIAGLRDVLIHEYFGVDLDLTWDIVKSDLPDLKKKIRMILDESASQS